MAEQNPLNIPSLANPFIVDTWLTIVVGHCFDDGEVIMLQGSKSAQCPKCGRRYQCTVLNYSIDTINRTPIGVAFTAPKAVSSIIEP